MNILGVFSFSLSLFAANTFIFNHGWYLLDVTGAKLSVGTSWSMIFLPAAAMLLIGQKWAECISPARRFLYFEAGKLLVYCGLIAGLFFVGGGTPVFVAAVAFGLFFSQFYPLCFTLISSFGEAAFVKSKSNQFEVGIQLSVVGAGLCQVFLYKPFGFSGLLLIAIASQILAIALWIFAGSQNFDLRPAIQKKSVLSLWPTRIDRKLIFKGLAQQIPANAILLLNVPLIFYVSSVLSGHAREFGIIELAFSAAAVTVSIALSTKWSTLFSKLNQLAIWTLIALIGMLVAGRFYGFWAFCVFAFFFAGFIIAFKMRARADFLSELPKDVADQLNSWLQAVSYLSLVVGCFLLGAVGQSFGAEAAMAGLVIYLLFFFGLNTRAESV